MNTETRVVYTFSVRDVSCKQNVNIKAKLNSFLVGFAVGLDFSDSL